MTAAKKRKLGNDVEPQSLTCIARRLVMCAWKNVGIVKEYMFVYYYFSAC